MPLSWCVKLLTCSWHFNRKTLNVMLPFITMSSFDTISLLKARKWGNVFLSNLNRSLYYEYIWKAMPKHSIWKVLFIKQLRSYLFILTYQPIFFFSFCHLCILELEVNGANTFFSVTLGSSHQACIKNARAWFFSHPKTQN